MSVEVEREVRTYAAFLDEILPTITADELTTEQLPLTVMPARRFSGPVVAVAAGVAVLVLVGGIAFLVGFVDEPPPADDVVPPTTLRVTKTATTVLSTEPVISPSGWTRLGHDPDAFEFSGDGKHAPHRIVLVGERLLAFSVRGTVWTSDDGNEWHKAAEQIFGEALVPEITSGEAGLVALGLVCPGPLEVPDGTCGEGFLPAVWHSQDGLTWRNVTPSEASPAVSDPAYLGTTVAYGPAGYLIAGGHSIWRSTDGIEWTHVPYQGTGLPICEPADQPAYNTAWFAAVFAGGPGYLISGLVAPPGQPCAEWSAALFASPDGVTWKVVADSEELGESDVSVSFSDVIETELGWVAAGCPPGSCTQGRIWVSPDRETWNELYRGPGSLIGGATDLRALAEVDGYYTAVGLDHSDGSAFVLMSPNGIDWQPLPANDPAFQGAWATDVVPYGSGLVAVGMLDTCDRTGPQDPCAGVAWIWNPPDS